jgi:GntR family transcriptional regulator/MocR family aminotransferase
VVGRGRAGTVVVGAPSITPARAPGPGDAPASAPDPGPGGGPGPQTGAALFLGRVAANIFEKARAVPARVDLSPGVPDLGAFPRTAWLRAERHVLSDLPAPALGYGDPAGAWPLRAAVANWLARTRGVQVPPAAVLVVAGVAQALSLLAQVLVQDGINVVAFEDPGSLGARQQLQNWQLGTVPVAVDAGGLRVDELRATGAAVVVLTPAHQFPMGVVLEGERRRQLLAWATEGGLVVEDDYDAEHRYDRPPLPALRANGGDRVIYMGSVSKLLAPALRIGWVIAPAKYHDAFVAAKRNADLGNAVLPQLVLAELVQSGRLERHLRLVRARHRQRRDAMLLALAAHLPTATVHGRAAGLHLTVTFDSGFSDLELAAQAIRRGIKVQPLSWHRQRPGPPGLVLGYAANTPGPIAEGIATLGQIARHL